MALLRQTMREWSDTELREARRVLVMLYDKPKDAERLICDLGRAPGDFDLSGTAVTRWHSVLRELNKQRQVRRLLDLVEEEYRDHEEVGRLCQIEPRSEEAHPPRRSGIPWRDAAGRHEESLSGQLRKLLEAQKQCRERGEESSDLDRIIIELKRRIRRGPQLDVGMSLGEDHRYVLHEPIGQGGFASVWHALDTENGGASVALKVLHGQWSRDLSNLERFQRGARQLGVLKGHPYIVRTLTESEEWTGFHYFVMEYVAGGDLYAAVRVGMIGPEEALRIVDGVADALQYAHARGVVHRDVKPQNILLTPELEPRLADFDLVHVADSTGGTRTGALGTVMYAAPEALADGREVDARADVYSLGLTALFVLYGKELPREMVWDRARTTEALLEQVQAPKALKQVIRRAVAVDRGARPGSMEAFLNAWRGARDSPTSGAVWSSDSGEDRFGRFAAFDVGGVVHWMRWIPPGRFWMASAGGEAGRHEPEGAPREGVFHEGFWLGETPVTQALWTAVMGSNPSTIKSAERPVEQVSWEDCQSFLARLNARVPWLEARLPKEAEWEYACRSGAATATWLGDPQILGINHAPLLDSVAWYGGNSEVGADLEGAVDSGGWPEKQHSHTRAGTQPVKGKQPNFLGLHDMLGNVWEWCEDFYRSDGAAFLADAHGDETGTRRVVRGGAWYDRAQVIRAASREGLIPTLRDPGVGLRLARSPKARLR